MKKIVNLKCPNCGSSLTVNEDDKYLKCSHCESNLLIEKDMDDEIKATINDNMKRNGKLVRGFVWYFMFSSIGIFFIIITIAIVGIIVANKNDNKISSSSFNFDFIYDNGTKTGASVRNTLDDVIGKNKKYKDHKITVIYNDIKTTNTNEIIKIKDNLKENARYEVILDYDKSGYMNKVTILDKD